MSQSSCRSSDALGHRWINGQKSPNKCCSRSDIPISDIVIMNDTYFGGERKQLLYKEKLPWRNKLRW